MSNIGIGLDQEGLHKLINDLESVEPYGKVEIDVKSIMPGRFMVFLTKRQIRRLEAKPDYSFLTKYGRVH